jgi:hypothetical protein
LNSSLAGKGKELLEFGKKLETNERDKEMEESAGKGVTLKKKGGEWSKRGNLRLSAVYGESAR